jgi:hypothetical protein
LAKTDPLEKEIVAVPAAFALKLREKILPEDP